MKKVELKAKERNGLGRKAALKDRKGGLIPGVIYGGKESIHFLIEELEVRDIVYTPNVYLINIDIEGKAYDVIVKDIQFHPVTDKIIHLDFLQIFDDKPFIINLPIKLVGDSVGIKQGGKLRLKRRYCKVKGLPKDLPDTLDVDITDLNIGQTIKIGDLNVNNLQLLDPHQSMLVGIVSSRLAAAAMTIEEDTAGEEGAAEAVTEGAAEGAAEGEGEKENTEE